MQYNTIQRRDNNNQEYVRKDKNLNDVDCNNESSD